MMGPDDWPRRDLLATRTASTPDRTALVDAATGRSWTYRELDRRVATVASHLRRFVADDGTVGLLFDNRIEFVELVHAAMRIGATIVPLNARLTADELRPQAEATDLDVLVCAEATEAVALGGATCPVVSVDEPSRDGVEPFEAAASERGGESNSSAHRVERDRVGVVMFTSGTTGTPKGVKLTYGNLIASATASAFRLGVEADDRWLDCLPMYHMGGLAPIYRSTLYGTTVVLQESFDAAETIRLLEEYDITGISLVPTMLARLLDAGWHPSDRLRFVLLGGAPASRALIVRCERRGVPAHPTYGMTETASQVATARPEEAFEFPDTVGQPLVGTTVRVERGDGANCEPGEPGELVIAGPTVSPGYLDDAHTDAAFDDGEFHTGDVGYADEDGRLWVTGRLDDRIITGGENVHPSEVVSAIREHPAVRDAAVVGVPDEEWGERVGALVVPNEGASLDAAAIRDVCDGRLAGYKRPRVIAFEAELPRTASGTVDRATVRSRLEDVASNT